MNDLETETEMRSILGADWLAPIDKAAAERFFSLSGKAVDDEQGPFIGRARAGWLICGSYAGRDYVGCREDGIGLAHDWVEMVKRAPAESVVAPNRESAPFKGPSQQMALTSGGYGAGAFGGSMPLVLFPPDLAGWSFELEQAPDELDLTVWKRYGGEDRGYRKGADWFVYEGGARAWQIVPGGVRAWRLEPTKAPSRPEGFVEAMMGNYAPIPSPEFKGK